MSQDNWIIEGVYYEWVMKCFQDADIIYVLDIATDLCKKRIIIRFLKRKICIEKGKKESFSSLYALLKWCDKYEKENMIVIKRIMCEYKEKVVYVHDKQQIHIE